MKKIQLLPLLILTFLSCSSAEQQGENIALSLAKDLSQVQSREELLLLEPVLRKKFLQIVAIAKKTHHEQERKVTGKHRGSDALQAEMIRIYVEIDGGKEIIERAQKEALHALYH